MKKFVSLVVAAAFMVAPVALLTKEHPKKEHPSKAGSSSKKEHPEHPKKKRKKKTGGHVSNKAQKLQFSKAVQAHIKKMAKKVKSGTFEVKDKKLGKTWNLGLKLVHEDRIAILGGNTFFACADFTVKNSKDILDLDFYAKKDGKNFTITEVLVHKVNGKPRYTYNAKNERVPVGGKKK